MAWTTTADAPPAPWAWDSGHGNTPPEEAEACRRADEAVASVDGVGLAGRTVLDIGCGRGACLREALALGAGAVTGVDLSPSSAAAVAEATGGRAAFVLGDGRSVPLPDGAADVVWSHGVAEHFAPGGLEALLREHVRLSRRWVVVSAPNPACGPYAEAKALLLAREEWRWGYEEPLPSYAPALRALGCDAVFDGDIGRGWDLVGVYGGMLDADRMRWWRDRYADGGAGVYTLVVARVQVPR